MDRPVNEWIGISGRFIHRFRTVYICCGSPERPSRFSFRNRFRFHAMRTRVCVYVCIIILYTLYGEKDKKRKSTVNRERAHTHTQVFRFQTVISIYDILLHTFDIYYYLYIGTQVRHAHRSQTLLKLNIRYNIYLAMCQCDDFFNGLLKYDGME